MHFIEITLEKLELTSSVLNLFDNSIGLFNISEIVSILFFILQLQEDCLFSLSYPV